MIDLLLDNGADLTCVNKIGKDVIAMAKHFKMATLYEYMVKIKESLAKKHIGHVEEILAPKELEKVTEDLDISFKEIEAKDFLAVSSLFAKIWTYFDEN